MHELRPLLVRVELLGKVFRLDEIVDLDRDCEQQEVISNLGHNANQNKLIHVMGS